MGLTTAGATALASFADEVGPAATGPVVAVGGRTQWDIGGPVDEGAREVTPPTGVVEFEPAEMTVRVRAGTTVAELDAVLGERGQCVALPVWEGATVGGVLAVGHSGIRRLGWGPVRDTLLEVRYVSTDGTLIKAGGPTVKNVSGFDLCRLMVGSLGTLGLLAELVLRTRPVPGEERWVSGPTDPFELRRRLYRPACVLWDGITTWALLDGHPDDVETEAGAAGLAPVDPEAVPAFPPHRWSLRPGELAGLPERLGTGTDRFVAEIGVGVVHAAVPQPPRPVDPAVAELNRRLKSIFDPTGRLAPGRSVLP
ncbi:MAG: FAD-binding protein [Acidimicrobiales bacterium]